MTVSTRWVLKTDPLGVPEAILESMSDVTHRMAVERMKSEFVSTVSHELRTPLTSVRGSLRLIEAGAAGPIPEKAATLVKIAHANSERLIRLINDLLDLEKIESGQLELSLMSVDANVVVARSMEATVGMAQQLGVEILASLPDSLQVQADPDRLIQALTNLLSNAAKWSARGQVVRVTASLHRPGWVRFAVTDHGPGIPAEKMSLLFARFQQLDSSDARQKGGTGLGLAIAKAIVEQHGGEIGVQSEPGKGSEFWFDVPRARATLASDSLQLSVLVVAGASELDALSSSIEQRSYRVSRAPSVDEALLALHRSHPNVIVLDLHLDRSLSFVERLRDGQDTRHIPVLLVGHSQDGAYGPTLIDWMSTPVDPLRLKEAVRINFRGQGRPKVLVVDDDATTRTIIVTELDRLGLESFEAADGVVGLELTKRLRPDLIVLDVQMPVLDGFGLVDNLRGGLQASIPLLVYSGRELSHDDREALRLGVTRFLTKSRVTEDQFIETVLELLGEATKPIAPSGGFPARPRSISPGPTTGSSPAAAADSPRGQGSAESGSFPIRPKNN
ncbi:MAG: response regulator [Deltaproteobacteria bacterium]|nr:response regulator [Deltaproteobacteria bacterium]